MATQFLMPLDCFEEHLLISLDPIKAMWPYDIFVSMQSAHTGQKWVSYLEWARLFNVGTFEALGKNRNSKALP